MMAPNRLLAPLPAPLVAGVTVLVGVVVATAQAGCDGEVATPERRPRPVRYAVVATGGAAGSRSFTAAITAGDATQLSFRVSGTLSKVGAKRGDTVAQGQLLAAVDSSDYRVQFAQARAQRQATKARRDAARTTLVRVEKLFESNSTSLSDYENAKTQLASAEAELAALDQQVRAARNQLKYTKLIAPFAGVINAINGRAGEAVRAGQLIAVLSKGSQIEVKTTVPEAFISRIQIGAPATVRVPSLGDREFAGTVSEVAFASEGASTYPVVVKPAEVDPALRPGMAAAVTFDFGGGSQELQVPVAAVGNSEQGDFVFLLEPAEGDTFAVRKRAVTVGTLAGEYFDVEAGLAEGDRVATAGLATLLEGMTVRLLER